MYVHTHFHCHPDFVPVKTYQGDVLRLIKVTRSEMGAYMCIASNGVPPTVSKRIMVNVHCKLQFILDDIQIQTSVYILSLLKLYS